MGMTPIIITIAITLPLPESPPPLNIQSNIKFAKTSVCHWPFVIANIMSNIFNTNIVIMIGVIPVMAWNIYRHKEEQKI